MAKDLNEVQMIGRLTRDCKIKTVGTLTIGEFSIATNDTVKRNGTYTDEVSFFNCTIFGNLAINIGKYMLKGKQIAIVGKLKQDRWEQDGQNRSAVKIICNSIQLLGGSSSSEARDTEEAFKAKDGEMQFNEEADF